jgi:uncharacterized protein with ParB-like and HNH nuclease domain
MAINPTPVTVGDLFGSKKYFVDFYQREYKWNDNIKNQSYKPIKALLDDIFYRFDLNYKPMSDINEQTIARYDWYYLNSFMTNTIGGNTYIVDGQQRLTTLTILTIVLWKIGKRLQVEDGKLRFLEKKICDFDANGEMVFWMGFPDRVNALKAIYNAPPATSVTIPSSATIAEKNIFEAYQTITAYLQGRLNNKHIFDAFRLYLYQRVYLISIDVDESKDVAMAFEVINDRGIPLKAYEILKGKILGIIDKAEVQPYVIKWEEAINAIADGWGDDDVDFYLSAYFQAKYSDTVLQYRDLQDDRYHKSIYLDEFDEKIGFKHRAGSDKHVHRVKEFVNSELPYFGAIYQKLSHDYGDWQTPALAWFNAINEQDTQFYLVLSAINLNDAEKDEKYNLVIREFDRLYTLSNLMGSYKSNFFGNDIIELGHDIRGKNCVDIKAAFDSTLIKIIAKAHNRNDITNPFKYELFANMGYSNLGARFLRYFFSRIDHFIATEANLSTGSYYSHISQARGKDVYHIEHILAHDDNHINAGLFSDEEEFIAQRNRLGGLVLLKGKDNQSSGNELYTEKLKTYVGNGTLFAQTLLKDFAHHNKGFSNFCEKYRLDFKTYSQFDGIAIEERQKLLFELVKLIWA